MSSALIAIEVLEFYSRITLEQICLISSSLYFYLEHLIIRLTDSLPSGSSENINFPIETICLITVKYDFFLAYDEDTSEIL